MKNTYTAAILILINLLWFSSASYSKKKLFVDGAEVHLPSYEKKRANPDGSGSVCVDVNQLETIVTICVYNKASDNIARNNGFVKYGELPPEGRSRISPLPDEHLVYVEGGYGALYEVKKERVGDFIVYETDNTLCDVSDSVEKRPAVCYVAALVPSMKPNSSPAIFVSAIIEQPPTPGGKLGKKAEDKVGTIKKIIKSIRLGSFAGAREPERILRDDCHLSFVAPKGLEYVDVGQSITSGRDECYIAFLYAKRLRLKRTGPMPPMPEDWRALTDFVLTVQAIPVADNLAQLESDNGAVQQGLFRLVSKEHLQLLNGDLYVMSYSAVKPTTAMIGYAKQQLVFVVGNDAHSTVFRLYYGDRSSKAGKKGERAFRDLFSSFRFF
ncbi:hypothetical protein [Burkholderia diffusa]|uniref:hypothetical protein n=1 Tax=Burkholderia diffusa TaxID=488732 RepID=UPI000A9EFA16|nr:hypothetical protein [Burkholderia diffusa]